MTHTFTRIVTFMSHISLPDNHTELLTSGSWVLSYKGKKRVFVVRKIFYDEYMTPMFTIPKHEEKLYDTMDDLLKDHPKLIDFPILDKDNYLKIYNNESNT